MTTKTEHDPFFSKLQPYIAQFYDDKVANLVTKVAFKQLSEGDALCTLQRDRTCMVRCLPAASLNIFRELMASNKTDDLENAVRRIVLKWEEVEEFIYHDEDPITPAGWFAMSVQKTEVNNGNKKLEMQLDRLMMDQNEFVGVLRKPKSFFERLDLPSHFTSDGSGNRTHCIEIAFRRILTCCHDKQTKYFELGKKDCKVLSEDGILLQMYASSSFQKYINEAKEGKEQS